MGSKQKVDGFYTKLMVLKALNVIIKALKGTFKRNEHFSFKTAEGLSKVREEGINGYIRD
jgi:hypothetical protein